MKRRLTLDHSSLFFGFAMSSTTYWPVLGCSGWACGGLDGLSQVDDACRTKREEHCWWASRCGPLAIPFLHPIHP